MLKFFTALWLLKQSDKLPPPALAVPGVHLLGGGGMSRGMLINQLSKGEKIKMLQFVAFFDLYCILSDILNVPTMADSSYQ